MRTGRIERPCLQCLPLFWSVRQIGAAVEYSLCHAVNTSADIHVYVLICIVICISADAMIY